MGLGYTLFGKPLAVLAAALMALAGVYMLPEYWPDHASASEAIRANDIATLERYLARGLSPNDRAQWRSYLRRTMGRATTTGIGGSTPELGRARESLASYALQQCQSTQAARRLVEAGADVVGRDPGGWTLLGRAAGCEDVPLVSAILERGADPNADEPDGGTVLWEPTRLGWRQRPFPEAIVAALRAGGATSRPQH
ncbi:MAG: ankyrin repeat domain-containing protein [Acidobacteria bacterium]|nr:ankyrin repeat domain-containing protein [Acidobacteriota bacterium]